MKRPFTPGERSTKAANENVAPQEAWKPAASPKSTASAETKRALQPKAKDGSKPPGAPWGPEKGRANSSNDLEPPPKTDATAKPFPKNDANSATFAKRPLDPPKGSPPPPAVTQPEQSAARTPPRPMGHAPPAPPAPAAPAPPPPATHAVPAPPGDAPPPPAGFAPLPSYTDVANSPPVGPAPPPPGSAPPPPGMSNLPPPGFDRSPGLGPQAASTLSFTNAPGRFGEPPAGAPPPPSVSSLSLQGPATTLESKSDVPPGFLPLAAPQARKRSGKCTRTLRT